MVLFSDLDPLVLNSRRILKKQRLKPSLFVELEQKKNIIIIAITSFFVLSRSITRMIHDIGKCLL